MGIQHVKNPFQISGAMLYACLCVFSNGIWTLRLSISHYRVGVVLHTLPNRFQMGGPEVLNLKMGNNKI